MRIIAGTKRKMNLYIPETDKIRPTTDRAKEALFNLIGPKINDSIFLDLYAGSGAISLEAKSRNAQQVYSVDNNIMSQKTIQKNIEKSGLKINFHLMKVDNFLESTEIKADICFLDAPFEYENEKIHKSIEIILNRKIIQDDGLIIVERKASKENDEFFNKYENVEIRKYGKVSFILIGER